MKIGLVLDDGLDKPDGVQQYVLSIGQWLSGQDHSVHYLVGETKRSDIANLHSLSHNVHVRFNRNHATMPLPAYRHRLKELLKQEQFDVLHVQMPYSPFLAGRLIKASAAKTAIVGTFHILPFSRVNAVGTHLLGLLLRRNLRRFNSVISVSPAAQAFARSSLGVDSIVIPNAVDVQLFALGTPLEKYKDGQLTILFLGRLVERKGCQYLLEAVNNLQASGKFNSAKLIICGRGPLEAELKKYVAGNNLGKLVQFTGFVDEEDKANYLASADIAVFPSTGGESFGIVLVEAMAAGAGVVLGGDNPGYRSVLGSQPDLLVTPKDTTSFATHLEKLMNDAALRQRLHVWQQSEVKKYDVGVVGSQIVHVYEQALQECSGVR